MSNLTDPKCQQPPYFVERQKYLDCQKTRGYAVTIGIVFIILVIAIFSIMGGANIVKTAIISTFAIGLISALILLLGPSSSASTWDMHHAGLASFAAARKTTPEAALADYHAEQVRLEAERRAAEYARRHYRPPPPSYGTSINVTL